MPCAGLSRSSLREWLVSDRTLTRVAEAVSDGEPVEWQEVIAGLATADSRAVVAQLQTLSQISARYDSGTAPDLILTARASPWLRLVIWLAAGASAAALAGVLLNDEPNVRSGVRLLVMAAFGGMGILLGWQTRDPTAFALAGVYWTIAASFAVGGVLRFAEALTSGTLFAFVTSVRPEAFLPAFLWQFASLFPTVHRFSRLERISRRGFILAVCLGGGLFVANLLPALVPELDPWLQAVNRMNGTGPGFWALVFGATLPALLIIPLRARRASPVERRRVRLFAWGLALGLGPVVISVLLESLWPWFGRLMLAPPAQRWAPWLIYPPILLIPAITAYAVTVHGVLRLRVVVRNRLKHLLASSFVAWITVTSVLVLATFVYVHRDQPLTQILSAVRTRFLVSLIAVGVTLLLFLRGRLMRLIDRWLAPGSLEHSMLLVQLGDDLRRGRTPHELAVSFAEVAQRALDTQGDVFLVGKGNQLTSPGGTTAGLPENSLIPVLIAGAKAPCIVEPEHKSSYYCLLHEDDRRWIDARQISVLVPLTTRQGQASPFAVVALHSRPKVLSLSREDIRFLSTASASVSFALEALPSVDDPRGPTDVDELAIQCAACHRVQPRSQIGTGCACGGAWETAGLPAVLRNQFLLESLLGAGGMGLVYRAVDRVLQRAVAVKTLPAVRGDAAERLLTEARTMAALNHPNVAVLYSSEMWRGTPLLIMEFLAGGTLAQRLGHGPLEPRVVIGLTHTLSRALQHVHASGRFHGDIKPSNIGLTAELEPKLLDFGLSRLLDDKDGRVGGTLPYLSPEVLRGEAPGPLLDTWALCVVFLEGITGVNPFLEGARTRAHILRGLDATISRTHLRVPAELAPFLRKALAADVRERPHSATELTRDLELLTRPLTNGGSHEPDN